MLDRYKYKFEKAIELVELHIGNFNRKARDFEFCGLYSVYFKKDLGGMLLSAEAVNLKCLVVSKYTSVIDEAYVIVSESSRDTTILIYSKTSTGYFSGINHKLLIRDKL